MIDLSSLAKALGAPVGAAAVPLVAMYSLFTPEQQFTRHVAEERTTTVQTLVETLRKEEAGPYRDTLCRTLEQTLTAICLDSPSHPFCADRTVLMSKAGC